MNKGLTTAALLRGIGQALERDAEYIASEAFQALSMLSDAQELIGMGRSEEANDAITHAKRHLLEIHDANPEAWRNREIKLECSLKS